MSDQRTTGDDFTSVRARRLANINELSELQFIGGSTAETMANAEITAEDIRNQTVTYLQLVNLGVDPGVASKIRREHSLSWSNEPAEGARLRRRARQIRHLGDGERAWIDASGRSSEEAVMPITTDGSGHSTEPEHAWQASSRADASVGESSRSGPPQLNPSEYTVPELEEWLEAIDDPEIVAIVLRAERMGEARRTALEAIERRLGALGAASNLEPWIFPADEQAQPAEPKAAIGYQFRTLASRLRAVLGVSIWDVVVTGLNARMASYQVTVNRAYSDFAGSVDRFGTRLRTLSAEDWRRLSLGFLLGLITLGVIGSVDAYLSSPTGPEVTVLTLLLVTVVVGVLALPLHWRRAVGGNGMAMLTALVGLGSAVLIAVISSGTSSLVTTPLALTGFALIAASLLTTTFFSEPM